MRWLTSILVAILLGGPFCAVATAHFGLVIPSHSMVMQKKQAALTFDIAFSHPFSGQGMDMQKPKEFFAMGNQKKTDLLSSLKEERYMNHRAWKGSYNIKRPGVYQFAMVPEPYFEPAEDCFIIHYTKTIVGAFGEEEGWQESLELPVEIVPLSRPFGNYSGNVFTGKVLFRGQPLPDADVEVEFLNSKKDHKAPNAYFETQIVKTDANGVFTFGIPWAGWWGFAALVESPDKLPMNGVDKNVELGGVCWVEFYAPQGK